MSRTTPWMALYVGDITVDTAHLSAQEFGAYVRIIIHYWQHEEAPLDNDARLARMAGVHRTHWPKVRSAILPFFEIIKENGKTGDSARWRHQRVEFEISKKAEISNKRKAAALQMHSNCNANAEQMHPQSQSPSKIESKIESKTERKKEVDTPRAQEALGVPSAELPEDRQEESAAPRAGRGPHAFEAGKVRLTANQVEKWKAAFSHLDLEAELWSLASWASKQPEWFFAISGALAKRNREIQMQIEVARATVGMNGQRATANRISAK